jgi:two-component system, LytTR family, sensor kinase
MKKSIVILMHIGYWTMYLLLITLLLMALKIDNPQFTVRNMGFVLLLNPLGLGALIPGVLGFYTSYLFLFRRYLATKRIPWLIAVGVALSVVISIISQLIIYLSFAGKGVNWSLETCVSMGAFLALIAIVHGAIGLVMQGFFKWFEDIRWKVDMDRKNYETELALLKSQINPHFLFNTINNIDMLIVKDATAASAYLNKLSDIMRFMLYETKSELISLAKELSYIEKFVELQKIRTINQHYVNYTIKGDDTNVMIPPMLFISFIENAFKHATNKKAVDAIIIHLDIEPGKIVFSCENNFNPDSKLKHDSNGLGNELIKKRLMLLYPNKHKLAITNNSELYRVELTLFQNEN